MNPSFYRPTDRGLEAKIQQKLAFLRELDAQERAKKRQAAGPLALRNLTDITMLDPILLRKDLQTVVDRLKTRGVSFDTERFNDLESRRKAVQTETESLQARRNALAGRSASSRPRARTPAPSWLSPRPCRCA